MQTLTVTSQTNKYNVYIGQHLRHNLNKYLQKDYSKILVITDESVAKLYLDDIVSNFPKNDVYTSTIETGESSKNIQTYYQLQTDALTYGLDRQSLIIALGGGVVGDLAGFVAATFMRGIDYIQMPTTVLAHDSSVGGKVAINHELGKNLIGNFYPPVAVIYDVDTLQSLPAKEIRSGYAEIIKEALIGNEKLFYELLQLNINKLSAKQLTDHILKGILVKADIVERDERESGERKYLNLGHTLAHALEAEFSYDTLTHGEAVAIGLLFSFYVSEQLLNVDLPFSTLLQWLTLNEFPLNIQKVDIHSLINHMKKDKKTVSEHIQMVLLNKIGEPLTKVITDEQLNKYLRGFFEELKRQ